MCQALGCRWLLGLACQALGCRRGWQGIAGRVSSMHHWDVGFEQGKVCVVGLQRVV